MAGYVAIPHDKLSVDALEAVLEEFITREGTDYGLRDHSLHDKKGSVRAQLERGEAVIVFDPRTESVSVVLREELERASASLDDRQEE